MSRLCDAAAVARSTALSGSSPMGLKLCRNFKYPPFLLSTCSENGDDKS